MYKIAVEPDSQQMTIWRMRIACWIPKVADTHSHYVTLIDLTLKEKSLYEIAAIIPYINNS
jgi:hypothetical protein